MANIFTVKHGSGQPNGKLIPFELGFDETGKKLYIGGAKRADGTLGDAIPITTPIEEMIIQSDTAGKMVYFNNISNIDTFKSYWRIIALGCIDQM